MGGKIGIVFIAAMVLGQTFLHYQPAYADDLMIASFESGEQSDIGTTIGTWTSNTLDTSQGTTMEIIPLYGVMGRAAEESHVLKITYDVATTGPAFNGIYIKLNDADLTPYDEMNFLIKGDSGKGFTTKFKVELKNTKGERATYVLNGITGDWQMLGITMQKFKALGAVTDWKHMTEISFTFDDMTVDSKEGVLYIDEVKFSGGTVVIDKDSL